MSFFSSPSFPSFSFLFSLSLLLLFGKEKRALSKKGGQPSLLPLSCSLLFFLFLSLPLSSFLSSFYFLRKRYLFSLWQGNLCILRLPRSYQFLVIISFFSFLFFLPQKEKTGKKKGRNKRERGKKKNLDNLLIQTRNKQNLIQNSQKRENSLLFRYFSAFKKRAQKSLSFSLSINLL